MSDEATVTQEKKVGKHIEFVRSGQFKIHTEVGDAIFVPADAIRTAVADKVLPKTLSPNDSSWGPAWRNYLKKHVDGTKIGTYKSGLLIAEEAKFNAVRDELKEQGVIDSSRGGHVANEKIDANTLINGNEVSG